MSVCRSGLVLFVFFGRPTSYVERFLLLLQASVSCNSLQPRSSILACFFFLLYRLRLFQDIPRSCPSLLQARQISMKFTSLQTPGTYHIYLRDQARPDHSNCEYCSYVICGPHIFIAKRKTRHLAQFRLSKPIDHYAPQIRRDRQEGIRKWYRCHYLVA